jgi:hypothetical protein
MAAPAVPKNAKIKFAQRRAKELIRTGTVSRPATNLNHRFPVLPKTASDRHDEVFGAAAGVADIAAARFIPLRRDDIG